MGRTKKVYDANKIVELYKKYGTVHAVSMRMSISAKTVKKVLEEQNIDIKKYVPSRFDIKQKFFGDD